MTQPIALVTDVHEYAGPAAVDGLLATGHLVHCHSLDFVDPIARDRYAAQRSQVRPSAEQNPATLVDEVIRTYGRLDVLVCNQFLPGNRWDESAAPAAGPSIRKVAPEDIDIAEFREILERLTVVPLALATAALPTMKAQQAGTIVFVTSAASYRAFPDMPTYAAARSATTSLAQAIAVAVAPFGIQVNAIGPAYFDNPSFFPAEHQDKFAPIVEAQVPTRRLARPDEMGALITFLASGHATPLTGQFLVFSSGSSGPGLRG